MELLGLLADAINESLGNNLHCEYNRHDKHEKRDKNEIGMNSIRGRKYCRRTYCSIFWRI